MLLDIFSDHLGANWKTIWKHSVVIDYCSKVQTLFCIRIDEVSYPKVKSFMLNFASFRSFIKSPTFHEISSLGTLFFYRQPTPENKVALNICVLLSWYHNSLQTRELFSHWFNLEVWWFKILVTEPGGPLSRILKLTDWNVW